MNQSPVVSTFISKKRFIDKYWLLMTRVNDASGRGRILNTVYPIRSHKVAFLSELILVELDCATVTVVTLDHQIFWRLVLTGVG